MESADKTRVQSFVVKPPSFQPNQKYPVLFLIHGGPEGDWGESWTYRWNAQVFASAGYLVVMPNPRGSIGYGQKFTEDIKDDWGGKPYDDIMAVVDHVAALPYADPNRMAAAGGSYGGYMIDWMLGHTQRFKALVSHAGVLRFAQRIRRHRGAVVPAVGVQRHALGQSRIVREVVAQLLREGFPHADAGDPRRAGFPRALHAGLAAFHRSAAAEGAIQAAGVSRRRALGSEAAEQRALVQLVSGLDRRVDQEGDRASGRGPVGYCFGRSETRATIAAL